MSKWLNIDEKVSELEGWCISNKEDGTLQIQKSDDMSIFATNEEALEHVTQRAAQGHITHIRALMRVNN